MTVAYVLSALLGDRDEGDLEYFGIAQNLLFGPAGLHLYAQRPDIQIGPLALLGGIGLNVVTAGHLVLASVAAALLMLLLLLRTVEAAAGEAGADPLRVRATLALGGVVLAASWAVVVPGWGHLDDLAALLATTGALRAARRGASERAGLLLAVGVACKPWAAFAVALLVLLPGWSARLRALGITVLGAAVCWLPFADSDLETVRGLARFQIAANLYSLPHALGYAATPHWTRAAQLVVATIGVLVCVRLRRWDLILLVVAVSRLALDGGVFPYYDAELVAGCLIADVVAVSRPGSVLAACAPLTVLSWVGMSLVHHTTSPGLSLGLRGCLYVVLLGAAAAPRTRARRPQPTAVAGTVVAEPLLAS